MARMTDQPLEPAESPAAEPGASASEAETEIVEPTEAPEPPPTAPERERHLRRSRDDRVIAGVCGGLGEYLRVDPALVRIAAVILVFAGGAGLVLYLIGWIAIPDEPEEASAGEQVRATDAPGPTQGAVVLGLVFVVLGIFFLLDELWPDFLSWKYVWPIALVGVGLAILLRERR